MDAGKRSRLEAAGIDVEEALGRFMDNEELMLRFLLRFPQDENFALLRQALEQGDVRRAFEAAHTLKGVAGNLSVTGVFRQTGRLVELLRAGDLAAASAAMPELEAEYDRAVRALRELAQAGGAD